MSSLDCLLAEVVCTWLGTVAHELLMQMCTVDGIDIYMDAATLKLFWSNN